MTRTTSIRTSITTSMKRRFAAVTVSWVALALALAASSAQALSLTVGGASCVSCDGAEITLEIVETAVGWDVSFILDSTGYDESRDGIAQVGFGAIKGWTSVSLVSAPTSSVAWSSPIQGNVDSSSLCEATRGNSGKICTSGFTDIRADAQYIWRFEVTGGRLNPDPDAWHIGGQYANASDLGAASAGAPNGRVISEEGGENPVPEPTAAVVFGVGAVVFGRRLRRAR